MKCVMVFLQVALVMCLGSAAGENVAWLREDVPPHSAVEISVDLEVDGAYTVVCRSRAEGAAPAPKLPQVELYVLREYTNPEDVQRLGPFMSIDTEILHGEEKGVGVWRFYVPRDEKATRTELALLYTVLDSEGSKLKQKRLYLTLKKTHFEPPTMMLQDEPTGESSAAAIARSCKPAAEDCILRQRVEVPSLFGTEPLLVELYRREHLITLVTKAREHATYDVQKITYGRSQELYHEQHFVLRPSCVFPIGRGLVEDKCRLAAYPAQAMNRGIGQFDIADAVQTCFGQAPTPMLINIFVADEQGTPLGELPITVDQFLPATQN